MKKTILLLLTLVCVQAFAQLTREEHKENYLRQIRTLGYCGVGVSTLLDRWEKAFPDDPDAKIGRFNYYLNTGVHTELVRKEQDKYMGAQPAATLKDGDGKPVKYFEETFYDDASFAESQKYIDEVISRYPDNVDFKVAKINALFSLEKEYPDIAASELEKLINDYRISGSDWTMSGEKLEGDEFAGLIQEYLAYLYSIGGDIAYNLFNSISIKMARMYPGNSDFLSNQGSFWLVVKQNPKKAISFYDKALKINPEDQAALKNRKISERQLAKKK
mgnify:CR=1 FL=1